MFEYVLIFLIAGLPACVAYMGRGSRRFRSIVGTINLVFAFILAAVAAMQLMADPPVRTAMASGFLSIVLAVTAVALRLPEPADGGPGPAPQQQAPLMGQQHHPGPWAAPQHPGMPGAPGQGGSPGSASPQQPWGPSGQ